MGLIGFAIAVIGIAVTPPKRRSIAAVGLVVLGFIIMAQAGRRPFQ
jgi:hypothetical protein